MIEAIAVTRDIVIILALIVIAVTVVIVGRAITNLVRKTENLRSFVADLVTAGANFLRLPIGRWRS